MVADNTTAMTTGGTCITSHTSDIDVTVAGLTFVAQQ